MITIRAIEENDAVAFCETLESVCRERKYLRMLEAPSLERIQTFVARNIKNGYPQFVALEDGKMVGWCDAFPGEVNSTAAHVAHLGMGVIKSHRGKGIGQKLLEATLARILELRLEKVELEVYHSNLQAIALYRKFGFVEEGRKKNGCLVDGVYDDVLVMALDLKSANRAQG